MYARILYSMYICVCVNVCVLSVCVDIDGMLYNLYMSINMYDYVCMYVCMYIYTARAHPGAAALHTLFS